MGFVKSSDEIKKSQLVAVEFYGAEALTVFFLTTSNPPVEECLRHAWEADVLVGIIAHRYGSVPEGSNISIHRRDGM